jgi:RND family efflux transporter MFP subunit
MISAARRLLGLVVYHAFARRLGLLCMPLLLIACSDEAAVEPQAPPETVRPAKMVVVSATRGVVLRSFPGTLQSIRKSELAFRIDGELVELPAQAGMRFRRGDLLARLDDADIRNQVADREARHQLAKTQYDKARQLMQKEYAAQSSLDEAEATLKAASAALQLSRDNLTYTELRAPFDGVIGHVGVENHQAVKARESVLQLQDDSGMDVVFSVPESLITRLRKINDPKGLCVKVRFNSRPEKAYPACYKEHDSVPDPLTRTYNVVHSMAPVEDFSALPGMAVNVEVDLSPMLPAQRLQGLLVPLGAVYQDDGKAWVWRVNEQMRVERVAVQTGAIIGDMLQVVEGLQVGDRVVAAGVSLLRAGQQVRPLQRERGL